MKRLVTTKELAELLGVAANTLRIWRAEGDGPPFYKLGESKYSGVRYDTERVQEWLAEREKDYGP